MVKKTTRSQSFFAKISLNFIAKRVYLLYNIREMDFENIIATIASVIVVLLALPIHEFAHAFAAVKAGDPTPKLQGRYTINPLKHFDLVGLIMLVVVHFGWAKPVPINPYNFKHLRRDYFWVSFAGILINLIMGFLSSLLLVLFGVISCAVLSEELTVAGMTAYTVSKTNFALLEFGILRYLFNYGLISAGKYIFFGLIYYILFFGVVININLALFNLIPVYPLDGFRILDCALKKKGRVFDFLGRKGYYVLLGLILWGVLCDAIARYVPIFEMFDVLGVALNYANGFIRNLFFELWGLFI